MKKKCKITTVSRSWWRLNRLHAEPLPVRQHSATFSGDESYESGDINF